jgi:hypothetical protein
MLLRDAGLQLENPAPYYCQKGGNTMYISVDFNHVNDCGDRTIMDINHVEHERDACGEKKN